MLINFITLASTKLRTLRIVRWYNSCRMETKHDEQNEKGKKKRECSVNRRRTQFRNFESTRLELADALRDVTTRRWWITRAITAWVVTALQITGDAAYYTTGGWRIHNVVVHALVARHASPRMYEGVHVCHYMGGVRLYRSRLTNYWVYTQSFSWFNTWGISGVCVFLHCEQRNL